MIFVTHSEEETLAAAAEIAAALPSRTAVLLIGDLGAGKTTMTKGIVEALGVAPASEVSSPTFTLIHEYGDPARVYHIDLYRLDTEAEVETLGLDELFDRDALVLIEWGERFPRLMPPDRWEIRIEHLGGDRRRATVSRCMPAWAEDCTSETNCPLSQDKPK